MYIYITAISVSLASAYLQKEYNQIACANGPFLMNNVSLGY